MFFIPLTKFGQRITLLSLQKERLRNGKQWQQVRKKKKKSWAQNWRLIATVPMGEGGLDFTNPTSKKNQTILMSTEEDDQ